MKRLQTPMWPGPPDVLVRVDNVGNSEALSNLMLVSLYWWCQGGDI